ncbi:MAG: hypothetical protein J6L88_10040 [Clostridia bacterium]|nr:hypothetical protein [Clostridia bacterium]
MVTINDLPDIEAYCDTIIRRIHGEISRKLEEKGVFGDRIDPLYALTLSVLSQARTLPWHLLDDSRSPEETDRAFNTAMQQLKQDLSTLENSLF